MRGRSGRTGSADSMMYGKQDNCLLDTAQLSLAYLTERRSSFSSHESVPSVGIDHQQTQQSNDRARDEVWHGKKSTKASVAARHSTRRRVKKGCATRQRYGTGPSVAQRRPTQRRIVGFCKFKTSIGWPLERMTLIGQHAHARYKATLSQQSQGRGLVTHKLIIISTRSPVSPLVSRILIRVR